MSRNKRCGPQGEPTQSLVIDPQKLAEIRAAIDALDSPSAPEEPPGKVEAFLVHEEPVIPAWCVETPEEQEAENRGCAGPGILLKLRRYRKRAA